MEIKRLVESSEVKNALEYFDDIFPNLKNRVSIEEYSKKMACNAKVYVLMERNEYIGFLAYYDNDYKTNVAFISLIGIAKAYQNRHLGKELLAQCENHCKETGMKSVRLEVRKDKPLAIRFYKNNGYNVYLENDKYFYMEKTIK